MNILFELICFTFYIIIGTILVKWYTNKKGWESSLDTSLLFTVCWKLIMFTLIIGLKLLIEFFWSINLANPLESYNFSLILMIVFFTLNILLGTLLFKNVFKKNSQESIFIILTIVIIELLIENLILYFIMYPIILSSFP